MTEVSDPGRSKRRPPLSYWEHTPPELRAVAERRRLIVAAVILTTLAIGGSVFELLTRPPLRTLPSIAPGTCLIAPAYLIADVAASTDPSIRLDNALAAAEPDGSKGYVAVAARIEGATPSIGVWIVPRRGTVRPWNVAAFGASKKVGTRFSLNDASFAGAASTAERCASTP